MVSEASFLSSGFGTYTREILKRLHNTGKYSIAEFACYGRVNDPKDKDIHWRYYANAVGPEDPRSKEYNSSMENQFGRWRFERVLLDFKPDVVIDVRDYWMNSYQQFSPLRPYFHWILMLRSILHHNKKNGLTPFYMLMQFLHTPILVEILSQIKVMAKLSI